jgi:hypothetical protein
VAGPKQVAIAACGANEVECGCGGQQAQGKNDHHLVDGVTEKFSVRVFMAASQCGFFLDSDCWRSDGCKFRVAA